MAELTQAGNGTGNRSENGDIIHAAGVLVFEVWEDEAMLSTPQACGCFSIIRAQGAASTDVGALPHRSAAFKLVPEILEVIRADAQFQDFLDHW